MKSFNVEVVITSFFHLLVPVRKMLRPGKRYNFLTEEDYTHCYMKDYRARIKNLEKRPLNW